MCSKAATTKHSFNKIIIPIGKSVIFVIVTTADKMYGTPLSTVAAVERFRDFRLFIPLRIFP
jgi:hypothetical protein